MSTISRPFLLSKANESNLVEEAAPGGKRGVPGEKVDNPCEQKDGDEDRGAAAGSATPVEEKESASPAASLAAGGTGKKDKKKVRGICWLVKFITSVVAHFSLLARVSLYGREGGKICVVCSRCAAWLHPCLLHLLIQHCVRLSIAGGAARQEY